MESLKGAAGEAGPVGPQGIQGIQGIKGDVGAAGLFSAMDILFEGNANTTGSTYNLLKPITDYKILAVEYGDLISERKDYNASFEWIVGPRVASWKHCYRGLRMIAPDGNGMLRYVIYWNFPTATTFTVGEVFSSDGLGYLAITKIYGIK